MQAVVGVAGGATRAALTQHQARRNNMADVSAKDGSQVRHTLSSFEIFTMSTDSHFPDLTQQLIPGRNATLFMPAV